MNDILKIYEVTYMYGGWVSVKETVVAHSKEEAIETVIKNNKYWEIRNTYAREFKIDGYVIEVYDEKTYIRDKNLEKLDI